MTVYLESTWSNEHFAEAIGTLQELCEHGEQQVIELEWRGGRPGIWQMAWVVEAVRLLQQAGVRWNWRNNAQMGLPSWVEMREGTIADNIGAKSG